MMMKISGEPGWGGDINIGEQPEAETLRRDYTDWTHDPEPDMHNWAIFGDQLHVDKRPHEELFKQHGHANTHKPFAYGRLALMHRWNANYQIEHSNIARHIVERLLRQHANKSGFKYNNIVDRDGEVITLPKMKLSVLNDPHTLTFLLHENGKDFAVYHPGYRHHEILPMGGEVGREWHQGTINFFNPKWNEDSERDQFPEVILNDEKWRNDPRLNDIVDIATLRHNDAITKEQNEFDSSKSASSIKIGEVPGIGNLLPGIKDWRHTEWMEDTPADQGAFFEDYPKEDTGDGIYSCPDCGMEAKSYEQLIHHMRDHVSGDPGQDWQPVVDYDQTMPAGLNTNSVPGWVALMSKTTAYDGEFADDYKGDDAVRVPFHHFRDTDEMIAGLPGDWHGSPHMEAQMGRIRSNDEPYSGEVVFTNFGSPVVHTDWGSDEDNAQSDVGHRAIQLAKRKMLLWRGGVEGFNNRSERTLPNKWNDPEWPKTFKLAAQQVPGPIPFVYDVEKDKIFVGHPGDIHKDIQQDYDPLGTVQCIYKPDGNIEITSDTNMPYTVKHLVQLWYYMHRELPVKNVFLVRDGTRVKLGNINDKKMVGQNVRYLVAADQAASEVNDALSPHGKVYVVGGAIRDLALGRIPKDVDMLAQGIDPKSVELLLRKKAAATGGSVNLTGKDFGVFRYKSANGDEVEIALPRAERSTGEGHKDFAVSVDPHMPIEQDLARRDFTPNAMAVDANEGSLHDPFGGWDDTKAGRLPIVSERAFHDDPLRILRALSAHSRYGLMPTPDTESSMAENADRLQHLPAERLQMELDKLMSGDNPSEAIKLAQRTGVLKQILPEVAATHGFDQRNKFHNQELFDHLTSVLHNVSQKTKDSDLRMAALLHDVGKPGSQWFDSDIGRKDDGTWPDERGWAHYYREHNSPPDDSGNRLPLPKPMGHNHEDLGSDLARDRLTALKYPNNRIDRITHLVKNHMFSPFTDARGARRFVNRVGSEHTEDLFKLREADAGNKANPWDGEVDNMRQLVNQVHEQNQPTGIASLAINGRDLIGAGIKPGPDMGRILNILSEEAIDDPTKNEREHLLLRAQELAGLRTASLYHTAPIHLRDSIFQHGIDYTKGASGTSYDRLGTQPANYLWTNIEDARADKERSSYNTGTDLDIWQVNHEGLNYEPDPLWPEAIRTREPIGPENISLVDFKHGHTEKVSHDWAHRMPLWYNHENGEYWIGDPGEEHADVSNRMIQELPPENQYGHDWGSIHIPNPDHPWYKPEHVPSLMLAGDRHEDIPLPLRERILNEGIEKFRRLGPSYNNKWQIRHREKNWPMLLTPQQADIVFTPDVENPDMSDYTWANQVTASVLSSFNKLASDLNQLGYRFDHVISQPYRNQPLLDEETPRVFNMHGDDKAFYHGPDSMPEHAIRAINGRRLVGTVTYSPFEENDAFATTGYRFPMIHVDEAFAHPDEDPRLAMGMFRQILARHPGHLIHSSIVNPKLNPLVQRYNQRILQGQHGLPEGMAHDISWKLVGGRDAPAYDNDKEGYSDYLDAVRRPPDYPVYANILDPIQPALDSDVFDDAAGKKPKVKPELAHWVVTHIESLLKDNGYEPKKFDIVLTGSLTTYQWSERSDFDVSVFPDYSVLDARQRGKLIAEFVDNLDGIKVQGTTHDLQSYVVPAGVEPSQLYVPGLRSGYDLRKSKWIVPPEKDRTHNPYLEVPATIAYIKEQVDKMKLLLKYDHPGAIEFWKQVHQRRRRDQAAAKGDYSESNMLFKAIGNAGLYSDISQLTGERL